MKLNEVFVKFITAKRPFVVMKTAITLDGKIATRTGASRWVAGKESLRQAHRLRNLYDAILVGINNVLVDDPRLNVRLVEKIKNPIRIVLDSYARTPLTAKVLSGDAKTIIAVGPKASKNKVSALADRGAEILKLPTPGGLVDLRALLKELTKRKISSLLVEGGGEVNASFLKARLVDKALFFIAPKIFGGRTAVTCVEGEGVSLPSQAIWLKNGHIEKVGDDILVQGYF